LIGPPRQPLQTATVRQRVPHGAGDLATSPAMGSACDIRPPFCSRPFSSRHVAVSPGLPVRFGRYGYDTPEAIQDNAMSAFDVAGGAVTGGLGVGLAGGMESGAGGPICLRIRATIRNIVASAKRMWTDEVARLSDIPEPGPVQTYVTGFPDHFAVSNAFLASFTTCNAATSLSSQPWLISNLT